MAPLMRILSTTGLVETEVADSDERSDVGRHWNAIQAVLGGDLSTIGDYEGVTVAGHELQTDPRAITRWGKEQDVEFEDIYESA
jgi:hypothetical protein